MITNLARLVKGRTKRTLKRFVKSVFKNHIYMAKHGLAKGFKVTGDLGFLKRPTLTCEDHFYRSLDLAGKTAYDVGSHIGIITLFFSKAVGESGKVVSFEPNPETLAISGSSRARQREETGERQKDRKTARSTRP